MRSNRLVVGCRWIVLCAALELWGAGLSGVACAGINRWTPLGPDGGAVSTFAIDPINPEIVYVGTAGEDLGKGSGGIFKSVDGGTTWASASVGLSNRPGVLSIAIDPLTPTTLYASFADVPSLYKSTDGGQNWSYLPEIASSRLVISTIVIDPLTPTTLYAGSAGIAIFGNGGGASDCTVRTYTSTPSFTNAGVFKSTDGGVTWSQSSTSLPSDTAVSALVVNSRTPTTLYVGTSGILDPCFDTTTLTASKGTFMSTDAGATWVPINTGFPTEEPVTALVIDPVNPTTLYASTFGMPGLYKTTNSGLSWTPMTKGLPDAFVSALIIDPNSPTILYAAVGGSLYKSTDGGAKWTLLNDNLSALLSALLIDPKRSNTLYAGTIGALDGGVFKSTDGGKSWTVANTGLTNTTTLTLAIDPTAPTTLYTSFQQGVVKSTDGGKSWAFKNNGLLNSFATLVIDPTNPQVLYGGTSTVVASSFTNGEFLGVYKTTDGGENWFLANNGLPPDTSVSSFAIDLKDSRNVYVATSNGIFKTTDAGEQWQLAGAGLPAQGSGGLGTIATPTQLTIDPQNPQIVYANIRFSACTDKEKQKSDPTCPPDGGNGLYKSTDGGGTWTRVSDNIKNPRNSADRASFCPACGLDPTTPTTLYCVAIFASGKAGYFKTNDGGVSWTFLDSNGPLDSRILLIDPRAPTTIYAVSATQGVAKSIDGGLTFLRINEGFPFVPSAAFIQDGHFRQLPIQLNSLVIDPTNSSRLYAATSTNGVFVIVQQ